MFVFANDNLTQNDRNQKRINMSIQKNSTHKKKERIKGRMGLADDDEPCLFPSDANYSIERQREEEKKKNDNVIICQEEKSLN